MVKISKLVKVSFTLLMFTSTMPALALQFEDNAEPQAMHVRMLQHKKQAELRELPREALVVTSSSRYLDVTAFNRYDKFVFTISDNAGFSKKVESEFGSLNIADLNLPYDGKFNYEVLAIQYTDELIQDVMNNGRPPGASTRMTLTQTASGIFSVTSGAIQVPEQIEENNAIPIDDNNSIMDKLFGGEQ